MSRALPRNENRCHENSEEDRQGKEVKDRKTKEWKEGSREVGKRKERGKKEGEEKGPEETINRLLVGRFCDSTAD